MKDSLGDRMKTYEQAWDFKLPDRLPLILRVDGKAFHTVTRNFFPCDETDVRPWSSIFMLCMQDVAGDLLKEVQNAKIAYVQSDEVSVLIYNHLDYNTESWFANRLQKIVSVAASVAANAFNMTASVFDIYPWVRFDARIFVLPVHEVTNYMIWRQKDAMRNSVSMLAREHFSHKRLQGLSMEEMKDLLMSEKGINWGDLEVAYKRGFCVSGRVPDRETPVFSQDRNYIERHLEGGYWL